MALVQRLVSSSNSCRANAVHAYGGRRYAGLRRLARHPQTSLGTQRRSFSVRASNNRGGHLRPETRFRRCASSDPSTLPSPSQNVRPALDRDCSATRCCGGSRPGRIRSAVHSNPRHTPPPSTRRYYRRPLSTASVHAPPRMHARATSPTPAAAARLPGIFSLLVPAVDECRPPRSSRADPTVPVVDSIFDRPSRVCSRKLQPLILPLVLDDNMVASVSDPQFVSLSNQLQGPIRPLPLEPVAQRVQGAEEEATIAHKRQQLRQVHVAPEHRVPIRNLDHTAWICHLEALHPPSRGVPHPPRLSESPHLWYPLPRSN